MLYNRYAISFLRVGVIKLAIVGSATVLVISHEVFGTNRYILKKIINEIRTSLPDTTETFDQIPTKQEVKHAIIDTCEIQVNTS
ncbi:unnamed protein product [Rotaria sordida]|uniref:Uncharacterized protein n=1 Tax=Rotaria sordida TaxID=392033 RepID=A0A818MPK0_9BILA|nr:unnamed protein product [Rotaria sordida]